MIEKHLDTILFDFDGTLAVLNVDFNAMRSHIRSLMTAYGISPDGLENHFVIEMIEAAKQGLMTTDRRRGESFETEAYRIVRRMEMEGAQQGTLFEGTCEMLDLLKKRGIKTAVVTRNCLEAVLHLFPEIRSYTGVVVTRESAGKVKPHPDHLKQALDLLDAKARDAAMVGDHPMDIVAGKEAGTYTIGVLTGFAGYELLREAGADIILESASILMDHLHV
ncbi:MAG: HAD-IA family hydrolase [Deltaproteobacteria bacterium]|nr:HAD-IA family hydrolase [Deltaproteobacteria bacterium]